MTWYLVVDPVTDELHQISSTPFDAELPDGCEPPFIQPGCVVVTVDEKPEGPVYYDGKAKALVLDDAALKTQDVDYWTEKKAAIETQLADAQVQLDAAIAAVDAEVDVGVGKIVDGG
jgi:hypothetical protein